MRKVDVVVQGLAGSCWEAAARVRERGALISTHTCMKAGLSGMKFDEGWGWG